MGAFVSVAGRKGADWWTATLLLLLLLLLVSSSIYSFNSSVRDWYMHPPKHPRYTQQVTQTTYLRVGFTFHSDASVVRSVVMRVTAAHADLSVLNGHLPLVSVQQYVEIVIHVISSLQAFLSTFRASARHKQVNTSSSGL